MIPQRNKELFLERISAGDTLERACEASHISKPSLFRFFRNDPGYRERYDGIVFSLKEEARLARAEEDRRNMERLREIIRKKKS